MTPPKRHQSQTERDLEGMAAKREREAAPMEFDGDDVTGRHEGDELRIMRSRRPTPERISRLEEKHDKLDEKVDAIHGDVREMRGELKTALGFMQQAQSEGHKTQRIKISTNGKVMIAIGTAAIAAIATVLKLVLS